MRLVSLLCLLTLAACGGGGGGTSTPTPVPTPAPPPVPVPTDSFEYGRALNLQSGAALASIDSVSGELAYAPYSNEGQSNAVHILPDFSYAGYGGGGVALPAYSSIPVRQTLSPQAGDDHARIQAAIDAIAALTPDARGIRGALLLEAGLYEIGETLVINASGIVLRGEGQGAAGTIMRATATDDDGPLIVMQGNGDGRIPRAAALAQQTDIEQDYVPVGSIAVSVASAAGYSVGDTIAVVRTPNDEWLGANGLDMAQYGWDTDSYRMAFERTVTAIEGNILSVDIQMVDTIQDEYGSGYVYRVDTSARLQQAGLENIRLETLDYADITREDRASYAVQLYETEQSWIRDVTIRYFSHGITFEDGTRFNTVQDVAFIDPDFEVVGGNHYAFDFNDGSMNLFQRCYSREGRHSFTLGSRATGPNVFVDCLAEDSTNDSGPHHRWAVGTLFDNTKDDLIRVQNRTTSGTGHGWAGAQQVLWNGDYDEIVLQAPLGAMNLAIGNTGTMISGSFSPDEPDGIIESEGFSVIPRSLYLQQLEERLGAVAVQNITTAGQQSGRIWDDLSDWAGEGTFDP